MSFILENERKRRGIIVLVKCGKKREEEGADQSNRDSNFN